jgi:AraC-like DNA-binding protein
MSLIRATALLGFQDLVRELGADPAELLARTHIPVAAAGDADAFISVRAGIAAIEAAATATGCRDFGRRLASRQGLDILGPLGVAARTAATFGDALEAIGQYMSTYSPALATTVQVDADRRRARFEWRLLLDHPPTHRQTAELGLGASLRVFRLLLGEDFSPRVVHFRHEPLTSTASYDEYFGCPVRFGKETTEFSFGAALLARPLGADSAVHEVVRQYLSSVTVPANTVVVEQVQSLIKRMLPTGGLSIELVASHLALHPRTLQRELAAEGESFASLLDQVRREEATRYLLETDVPLGQLSGLLGYSEQSVLARACRRWFGSTASAFRRDAGVRS